MSTSHPLLSVRVLHVYYGNDHILRGVNLEVGTREVVSLLGRSGFGRPSSCAVASVHTGMPLAVCSNDIGCGAAEVQTRRGAASADAQPRPTNNRRQA